MTRDSRFWWVVMIGAVATAIMSRMDLLESLLPAQHTDQVHAIIELIALVAGVVGGKMATSPLPISDEGRAKYLSDVVKPR